jgi:hypothetical protein
MRRGWILGLVVVAAVCAIIGMGIVGASETKAGSATKSEEKTSVCQKVVRHVVCFKFKDTASPEEVQKVCDAFANLKNEIPFILSYEAGSNVSPENLSKGFTHCYILTFKNQKDRDAYLPHPAHKAFGGNLRGLVDDVFVIDIETSPGCCGQCGSCAKGASGSVTQP